ncbi:MAG: helix-turn-helix domain-containing protein [Flavobacteriales bacterium]|jgi:AraC-like DNA-binding protein
MTVSANYQLPGDYYSYFNLDQNRDINVIFYKTDTKADRIKLNFQQNVLIVLGKGDTIVHTDREYKEVGEENVLLISEGTTILSENLAIDLEYRSVLIFFSDDLLLRLITNLNSRILSNPSKINDVVPIPKDEYIDHFEKSIYLLRDEMEGDPVFAQNKCQELLIYLIKHKANLIAPVVKDILNSRNNSIRDTILKHENSDLTIEELAFLCNMSLSTFKRKFAEMYDTTPKKFFIRRKMERAVYMLKQQKLPSEIYYELGYENLSSFSVEFKKHFGVSPKHFGLIKDQNT